MVETSGDAQVVAHACQAANAGIAVVQHTCDFSWYTSCRAGGETCTVCQKQWSRGGKLYRCWHCKRVACKGCREMPQSEPCSAAMRKALAYPEPERPADPEQREHAGDEAWWAEALREATSEPAPPTLKIVPSRVKQRIKDLMLEALNVAVLSTEQQEPEADQLAKYRWLWVLPSLLLAKVPVEERAEDTETESTGQRGQSRILQVVKERCRLVQEGEW